MAGARLLTRPLQARRRPRSPRYCASVCCSCRSSGFRRTRRCRRRSMRRRCSGARTPRGLVNAVLRRFQREREQLDAAAPSSRRGAVRASALAHRRAARRSSRAIGRRSSTANNAPPPMWLRVNSLRTTRAEYLAKLEAAGLAGARRGGRRVRRARSTQPVAVEALPGFAAGEVSVQDVVGAAGRDVARARAGPARARCLRGAGRQDRPHSRRSPRAAARSGPSIEIPRALAMVRENLERLGLAAKLVAGDATAPDGLVGRQAVRPDSARRAVQRDRRHSPSSRHQSAAPARRTSIARRDPAGRAASGAVAAAGPGRPAGLCDLLRAEARERRADRGISRRGAGDRAGPRASRLVRRARRRRTATASIMLGYGSRTCCESPSGVPPQP